jgi:hypothetical protein
VGAEARAAGVLLLRRLARGRLYVPPQDAAADLAPRGSLRPSRCRELCAAVQAEAPRLAQEASPQETAALQAALASIMHRLQLS